MAVWDKKPPTVQGKQLYNLMAENTRILTNILKISQKQLDKLVKLYAKHPEKLYKALQYWISQGTVLNPAYTNELVTYLTNLGGAYNIGLSLAEGTPIATQAIIKTVMQDSVMNNITKLDTSIKQKLADTLTEGYSKGQFPQETVQKMQKHLQYNEYRASMITHTESMRASNAANWSQSKVEGATHFTVDVRAGACKWCVKTYEGRVFRIDEVKYLPPIHPWCSCTPRFFFSEEEAQADADMISQRNTARIKELKDKGFSFPENGTGPLSPKAQEQRRKK